MKAKRGKWRVRHYLLPAAAALGLIGSFLLPNAVAGVMDARRLDNLLIVDAQSISFDADPELSLPGRIALAVSPNTEVLALTTGQVMELESAESRAITELVRFFSDGPIAVTIGECTVESGSAAFVIDSEDPAVNMIIWEFRVLDQYKNEATVTIDDETGVILKLIYQLRDSSLFHEELSGDGVSGDNMRDAALWLSEMMTAYYGLPVRLGDYQLSGSLVYYRVDLYGGGLIIPMYGVVRANSFTMNERI